MTEQEAIQKYRDMEERLQSVYGECDGLLESVVAGLEKHEGIKFQKPIKARLLTDEHVDMWEEYKKIGTPEECRAAVEKQKGKKPKEYEDKFYGCPSCGNILLHKWEKYNTKLMDKKNGLPYCLSCGQKLDWSE